MKIHINPKIKSIRSFVESLPETFPREGATLHAKRNTIKVFDTPAGRMVVKSFQQPNIWRAAIYTFLRKGKAQRSYEHAVRLRALGIDSPEPIAWCVDFRHGLLGASYYVSRYSEYKPLSVATADPNDSSAREVLDAFAHFAVQLHTLGIEHQDFNQGNILWRRNPTEGVIRFQLIDINRMRFTNRPLGRRASMVNLRRLSCPAIAFLYLLDRYAEVRNWSANDTLLRGTFFRLLFGRRKELHKRVKQHIHPQKR